jgi:hypothetical protein
VLNLFCVSRRQFEARGGVLSGSRARKHPPE